MTRVELEPNSYYDGFAKKFSQRDSKLKYWNFTTKQI